MDQRSNPFSPGAGLRPPELAGRQKQLADFEAMMARSATGLPSSPLVLFGLRGVGKTVLLEAFQARAEDAHWQTMNLEAAGADPELGSAGRRLARELERVRHKVVRRRGFAEAVKAIDSFSLNAGLTGGGIAIGRHEPGQSPVDLELALLDVVDTLGPRLAKDGTGLALFIDELQDLDPTVTGAVIAAQHRAAQRGWPFILVGAGLPSVRGKLAAVRSYAERFSYTVVDKLDHESSRAALAQPAERLGVRFNSAGLDLIAGESQGYPFFLQTFGYHAWRLAEGTEIDQTDARQAIEDGWAELDDGFFTSRWERATKAERTFLEAMLPPASSPDPGVDAVAVGQVGARMGKSPSQLSTTRAALIAKGLVYAPERGRLAFTVPGIAAFIQRRSER
ncbi:MAG: ATP-binding protein [Bifidobacteriaceae bacterium]|nr:ATP-binding protein [Bifidobacteriaceae bacterium]